MHDQRSSFAPSRFLEAWNAAEQGPAPVVEFTDETGSTNDDLAARIEAGPVAAYTVLGTDFQSAGRGRLQRTWTTPPRTCLTFSVAVPIPPTVDEADLGWISLIAGASVVRAVRDAGLEAGLKWPNDVLVGERKVAGILSRLVFGTSCTAVVGIGINVDLERSELPVETATSLRLEGCSLSREELLAGVLGHLIRDMSKALSRPRIGTPDFLAQMSESMVTLGRTVRVELPGREPFDAVALKLEECGGLVVESATGRSVITAGDVVHARLL